MSENQKKCDKAIYELAMKFLLEFDEVDEEKIKKQLNEVDHKEINSTDDVFFRLIESLQNANMKANVIGGSIGGFEKLKEFIGTYESMDRFSDEKELLIEIFNKLDPNSNQSLNEHLNNNRSMWLNYTKSMIEAKKFLNQFSDLDDFRRWVDFFDKDERSRPALPMILSNEISGLGFALACDFLKEIGYSNFGKPDVHIKNIFYELGLSQSKSDYQVLKDIARVSKHVGESSYNVDKLFWLIGSGKFYLSNIEIGRQRKKFIKFAKDKLPKECR